MTDPISLVLGAAALGGAAGKTVELAWEAGEQWIRAYLGGHGDEVQRRAQENTLEFLSDLSIRLKRLEEQLGRSIGPDELKRRLSAPDFAATLQAALISSARTESREKHKILADVVAARLQAEPESMEAVIAALAVETVPRLALRHLDFLGLLTLLRVQRSSHGVSDEEANKESLAWLGSQLEAFPSAFEVTMWDAVYLDGLSCLRQMPNIMQIPRSALLAGLVKGTQGAIQLSDFLREDIRGQKLASLWMDVLHRAEPTPVGSEIGRFVYRIRNA